MSTLVRNSIITPDGTVLISRHQHDYVAYTDKNGKTYGIDGGLSGYGRIIGDVQKDCINNCVYSDDDFEKVREAFEWGTRGPEGDRELTFLPLKDLESAHIQAILDTQRQIKPTTREIFEKELDYRRAIINNS